MNGVDIATGETIVSSRARMAIGMPRWVSSASVAVIDQFLVSGTNFLTVVVVGRVCGPTALGTYSLAATVLLLLAALAEALITGPYAIHLPRMLTRSSEYTGSLVAHACLLGGISTVLVFGGSKAVLLFHGTAPTARSLAPVAIIALPVILREVARRHAFAHNKTVAALILDVCVCSGQIIALLYCASRGVLSSTTAILLIGSSCITGCVFYFLIGGGKHFHVHRRAVLSDLTLNLSLGKWLLGSQVTMIAQFTIAQWAITLTQGPAQNGILMAASSVAMVANPALTGLSNLILPKAARMVQSGGNIALRRLMKTVCFIMTAASAAYCLFIASFGHRLGASVYGQKYTLLAPILLPLALTFACRCIAMPPYIGLWVLIKAQSNVYINLIAMVSILFFIVILRPFGVAGVACSMMLGEATACLLRWCMFFKATKRDHSQRY